MHANAVSSYATDRVDPLVLVAEISHRVVNEYSQAIAGIRIAARNTASSEAREILATAVTRLHSFAEAHRALQAPRSGESLDLADYLQRLCEAVTAASLQERGIRLTLIADRAVLAPERCWRVALVVSELITNCVRHGLKNGPGCIRVEMVPEGTDIICRVSDDGCGAPHARPGRGLGVVMGLAEDLGGIVGWHFTPEGTVAELIFPHLIEELQHDPA
jgi:two-component sensor histidine kinase